MTRIAVLGAGAFGTALAVALARAGREVTLWARDAAPLLQRGESARLPGVSLPPELRLTGDLAVAGGAEVLLLAMPMQALHEFLATSGLPREGRILVACSKGIDLATGRGPGGVIALAAPGAIPAVLSGPGFAADIAQGLPTALTLGCADPAAGALQELLSGETLRIYRSDDVTGVETGGAVKNVIAIACGIVIGAGLGESARAALVSRGYAEMRRFALWRGGREATLAGLSGLGDLVLTATSPRSRNYAHGLEVGRSGPVAATGTVEGVATAHALAGIAANEGLDMPITTALALVLAGRMSVAEAVARLMRRPLKMEIE